MGGGAVGEITEETNKHRELRWKDSDGIADLTACNAVTCRTGGSTSCGMSDWTMKVSCASGSDKAKLATYKKAGCTNASNSYLGFYTFNASDFNTFKEGNCAPVVFTSTWSTCGTTYTADCDTAGSVKITGTFAPLASLCGSSSSSSSADSGSGSGGNPSGDNQSSVPAPAPSSSTKSQQAASGACVAAVPVFMSVLGMMSMVAGL